MLPLAWQQLGVPFIPPQVTKVPRAAGAVLLAPLVERLIGRLQQRLGLASRRAVFGVFVAGCIALALAVFGATVLAWA